MPCKDWHFRTWGTEDSDIHGLKHITREKGGKLRKLVWLVCFLTAAGYFLYLGYNAIWNYLMRHHITKVDITYVNQVEFPAVTVCNFNKYRESALTEHDIKNVGFHLGIIDKDHNLIDPHLYTEEFQRRLQEIDWSEVDNDENYNMTEFQLRTGHQLEDMIIQCDWKEEPCAHKNFIHRFTHYGNCYTFNDWTHGDLRHNSSTAGASNGLRLIIDIEEIEYAPTNDLDGAGLDAGIKVMLHHPTEPPYIKELGFSTAPGMHTFVTMKHEQISSLGPPYTICQTDGDAGMNYYSHYSFQACRIECETDVIVKECGCRLAEQPGDAEICNPENTHLCAHPLLVDVIKGTSGHADCACRNPCEVMHYPSTLSLSRLRPAFIQKMFHNTKHNMTKEYIAKNIAAISVYYEALNYETIEQRPEMDFLSLLATIGGHLGLFLGASLLSFIQIVEYLSDETLMCLGCMKKKETSTSDGRRPYNDQQLMAVQNRGKSESNNGLAVSVISGTPTHNQNM
ncbi:acid-sensing ion channel 2-like [Amphiura filiformis]|uniref:acid-sensing ion channel 2-like n=1 Tax=Amphiura filiformis TaxID=82378 RepID=UPI003B225827